MIEEFSPWWRKTLSQHTVQSSDWLNSETFWLKFYKKGKDRGTSQNIILCSIKIFVFFISYPLDLLVTPQIYLVAQWEHRHPKLEDHRIIISHHLAKSHYYGGVYLFELFMGWRWDWNDSPNSHFILRSQFNLFAFILFWIFFLKVMQLLDYCIRICTDQQIICYMPWKLLTFSNYSLKRTAWLL